MSKDAGYLRIPRPPNQFREGLPVPGVWSTSARTYERGIGLRDLHDFRDFPNFPASEQWLNSLDVALLRQPTRQAGRVPPSICNGMVADGLGNLRFYLFALGFRVTEQRNLCHVFP